MSKKRDSGSSMIPCGGKGWPKGKCFDCQLDRGRDPCPLKNVPRERDPGLNLPPGPEVTLEQMLIEVLQRQMRRGYWGGGRGRHATEGKDGRGRK